ncbi:MAG TPA: DUF1697 domain-containing protein [Bosea sp. (in: a-proteobacteria)]|jgi:uncharacterized protein (DUF1697 family)|uniref:DUF1697 domain-containing protein n=1 Tax=Bosea sp. (in: a-proteobacteria) TaxID=1871050 RepID=UPI002E14A867|nr:DUF1697 domain-containing protein [Bosea sp. (in: a-proteobacteria)]
MPVTIFLLRAVNVGGATTMKMEALRDIAEALGFRHATTLLQSGNLVAAHDGDAGEAVARLEAALARDFPYAPGVIGRSRNELDRAVADNPLPLSAGQDPKFLQYVALASTPEPAALESLTSTYAGPETIALRGADLFVYYAEGVGRSKLTNALIERRLGVKGTARNWNTVTKLAALAGEIAARG